MKLSATAEIWLNEHMDEFQKLVKEQATRIASLTSTDEVTPVDIALAVLDVHSILGMQVCIDLEKVMVR